jgi:hypothetical protein
LVAGPPRATVGGAGLLPPTPTGPLRPDPGLAPFRGLAAPRPPCLPRPPVGTATAPSPAALRRLRDWVRRPEPCCPPAEPCEGARLRPPTDPARGLGRGTGGTGASSTPPAVAVTASLERRACWRRARRVLGVCAWEVATVEGVGTRDPGGPSSAPAPLLGTEALDGPRALPHAEPGVGGTEASGRLLGGVAGGAASPPSTPEGAPTPGTRVAWVIPTVPGALDAAGSVCECE